MMTRPPAEGLWEAPGAGGARHRELPSAGVRAPAGQASAALCHVLDILGETWEWEAAEEQRRPVAMWYQFSESALLHGA